jgi:predicted metal-binding protein
LKGITGILDEAVLMKRFDRHLKWAKEKGLDHVMVIETSKVYTAAWVRRKCQFGCRFYNNSLCCPPRTPGPAETRQILNSYSHAILLHKLWKGDTSDIRSFNEAVVAVESALFLDGYYKAWGLGSGPCRICEKCNIGGGCLNISIARPSMEACGIDVYRTAEENGLKFQVLKHVEKDRNSFGVVLVE